jgi:recombination protein RecA
MATKKPSEKEYQDAIKLVAKKFGEGVKDTGMAEFKPSAIPTGHDDLDCLLTRGAHGVYLGGIIELMGSEGSGKTSLALRTAGHAQKLGHRCCWIDAESAFNEDISKLNGCDPTKLQLPSLEDTRVIAKEGDSGSSFFNASEVLEMVYNFVITDVFGLIVLDSVAGLMPDRVLTDDDPNKVGVAEVARAMSDKLRKLAPACKKTKTSVIFINQLRDQPGAWVQNRFHSPGGRALKFFAHQRLSVERRTGAESRIYEDTDRGKELIGHYSRITIVKNKVAPPVPDDVKIDVPIYYKEYFPDLAKKCYELARSLQVITIRNGVLTWKDGDSIVLQEDGESAILAKIREEKMEPRLAAAIVEAESGEKNTKKKQPVRVPKTVKDVADTYSPEKATTAKKSTTRKSKLSENKLDLDD